VICAVLLFVIGGKGKNWTWCFGRVEMAVRYQVEYLGDRKDGCNAYEGDPGIASHNRVCLEGAGLKTGRS